MAQQVWHVRNCSLFERLSQEQLSRLEQRARIRSFPRNSAVYLPSDTADGAFLLAAGRIRICSITPDGKQAILGFVEPGELFGELALVESGLREERAEAVSDSSVVLLPGDELRRIMEDSAALSLGITKLIGFRRRRIERRLRNLLFRSNRERLGHLLMELAEEYGRSTADGVALGIKLSHQELAAIIGSTRETVTLLLGEMQLAGLIKVGRQKVVIRNLEKLAKELETEIPRIPSGRADSPRPPLPHQVPTRSLGTGGTIDP